MSHFEKPAVPYALDALNPVVSEETMDLHHNKHVQAYVDKANALVPGTEFEGKSIEEIVTASYNKNPGVFNNVAQIWNHGFFWHCMTPSFDESTVDETLLNKINKDFGSLDGFKEKFKAAGVGQFGSGWVWLVEKTDGSLDIYGMPNAENPLIKGDKPLLGCDVWEHSYYVDYRNKRPDFLDAFVNKLINWDFVAQNLSNNESYKIAA